MAEIKIDLFLDASGAVQSLNEVNEAIEKAKQNFADAKTTEDVKKYADEIKSLEGKVKEFNEQVAKSTAGSTFEKVGISLRSMGDNLANLNFKGVNEDIKKMAGDIKNFSFKEFISGMRASASAAWQFTTALLANPVGAIAAAVVGLVAVLALLLKSLGLLNPLINAVKKSLDFLLDILKRIGDFLGLTNFAFEEFGEAASKNMEKARKAHEKYIETVTEGTDKTVSSLDREIRILEAKGASEEQIAAKKREKEQAELDGAKAIQAATMEQLRLSTENQANIVKEVALAAKKENTNLKLADLQAEFFALSEEGNKAEIEARLKLLGLDQKVAELLVKSSEDRKKFLADAKKAVEDTKDQSTDITVHDAAEEAKRTAKAREEANKRAEAAKKEAADRKAAEEKLSADILSVQRNLTQQALQLRMSQAETEEEKTQIQKEMNLEASRIRIEDNNITIAKLEEQEKKLTEENKKENEKQLADLRILIEARKKLNEGYTNEVVAKNAEADEKILEKNKETLKEWQDYRDSVNQTEADKIQSDRQKALAQLEEDAKASGMTEEARLASQLAIHQDYNNKLEALYKGTQLNIAEEEGKALDNATFYTQKQFEKFRDLQIQKLETQKKAALDGLAAQQAALVAQGGEEAKNTEAYINLEAKKNDVAAQFTESIFNFKKSAAEREKTLNQETLQNTVAAAQQALGALSSIADTIAGFAEARFAKEENALAKSKKSELEAVGDNEDAKYAIEMKYFAKEQELKKKKFEANKRQQIAQAIISGAQAVLQALASSPPPLNFIMAGIVGAATLAQIAKIKSTQFEGDAAPTPPTPAGGTEPASAPQPSFQFVGQPNTGNELGNQQQGGTNGPTQVNVNVQISESEITNTQTRVAKMGNASEL